MEDLEEEVPKREPRKEDMGRMGTGRRVARRRGRCGFTRIERVRMRVDDARENRMDRDEGVSEWVS